MNFLTALRGHVTAVLRKAFPPRIAFLLIGLVSTIWFIVRVVPKPSRASYPCMQAAAPIMSGFVVYLLGIASTVFALRRFKENAHAMRPWLAAVSLAVALCLMLVTSANEAPPVYANSTLLVAPNQPVGRAKGINPGRVVWSWNPAATNEACTNTFGDGWFQSNNTDLTVVQLMMDNGVRQLTGKATIRDSWDALFRSFNKEHGKGDVGYTDGEKIFIRTNQVSASDNTLDATTYAIKNQSRYGMAETSPQVALAVLRHLVNECGVRQENISIGDPMKHMYKHVYDLWHNEFPNVVYVDSWGTLGRTKPVAAPRPVIYYSDRGSILKDGGTTGNAVYSDVYPTVITEASYLVAIPALKAHARGGVTLSGKLHFGSNLRGSATHLHGGLVAPNKVSGTPLRPGYGLYRVQVDLMGHKDLGRKTVLFIVDGLWGGSEANDPPRKFATAPFNNDWTSSLFLSQDQVALESVCFDFLKSEFTAGNPYGSYPQIEGADDYILQAADSTYWPAGFSYDPEADGTPITSLGVCEHWNNPTDKQYSRNLNTGNGIELVRLLASPSQVSGAAGSAPRQFELAQNYPNPFNAGTKVQISNPKSQILRLSVFDVLGKEVAVLANGPMPPGKHSVSWDASQYPSGMYICRVSAGAQAAVVKMVLLK